MDIQRAGEKVVRELLDKYFIIRTSWVYGKNGNNFVKTMLRLAQTKDEISVVNDRGAPTYTKDLAVLICSMIQTTRYGTYHAGYEECSCFNLQKRYLPEKINIKVNAISSEEYPAKAKRPLNSRCLKKILIRMAFRYLLGKSIGKIFKRTKFK